MAADSSGRNNNNDSFSSLIKTMGGDDCDRPACDGTKSALSAALKRVGMSSGSSATGGDASSDAGGASSGSTTKHRQSSTLKEKKGRLPNSYNACPPTKDEIGASAWSLVHSMAAWYPNEPTPEDKRFMSNFMTALARFYPCTYCATDFQRNLQLSPPRTETREDLCIWLCEQHNIVNEKLGKPEFNCSMDNLDERWRKSSNPDC